MPKSKGNWKRRITWAAGILALCYLLAGFVLVPIALKLAAPGLVSSSIVGNVRIGWVWMNPLTFSVTLRGVQVTDAEGADVIRIDRVYANVDPIASIFRGELAASRFALHEPIVYLVIEADGSINLVDALAPLEPAPPRPESPPIDLPEAVLDNFDLVDAEIHFTDRSRAVGFERSITSINLFLDNIRTRPEHENAFDFAATIGVDEVLLLSGVFQFNPLSLAGSVSLEGLELADYAPFYEEAFAFEITSGRARGAFDYAFEPLGENGRLGITAGSFGVSSIELRPKGSDAPFFFLESAELSELTVDLLEYEGRIGRIDIQSGFLRARLLEDGSLDLLEYLLPPASGEISADQDLADGGGAAGELEFGIRSDGEDLALPVNAALQHIQSLGEAAWTMSLGTFAFGDFALELDDATGEAARQVRVHDLEVLLENVTNAPGERANVSFSARLNDEGTIQVSGVVVPDPAELDLEYTLAELDLGALAHFAESLSPVRLVSAVLGMEGRATAHLEEEDRLVARILNRTTVRDFLVRIPGEETDLLRFDELQIGDTTIDLEPLTIEGSEVFLRKPYARVDRLEDGSLALLNFVPAAEPEEPGAGDPGDPLDEGAEEDGPDAAGVADKGDASGPELSLLIARVQVEDGTLEWSDASVNPTGNFSLSSLNFSATNVSLDPEARTDLTFSGNIAETGTANISGSLALGDPLIDTQVDAEIRSVPLAAFSPYAIDAVGRPIDQGAFSGDFTVAVESNHLDASNQLRIQTLRFGRAAEGSTGLLPVGVAIAALENSDGVITLDVPISGDLDNPDFDPAGLFLQIVRTTAMRALTAPLSIAGSMLGGSIPGLSLLQSDRPETDLSAVRFDAGQTGLTEAGIETLEALTTFLGERPRAQLLLTASVDPAADAGAEALARLNSALAQQQASSRTQALRELYAETFGGTPPEGDTAGSVPAKAAPEDGKAGEDHGRGEGFYLREGAHSEKETHSDRFYTDGSTEQRTLGSGFYTGASSRRPRQVPATAEPADAAAREDTGVAVADRASTSVGMLEQRLLEVYRPDEAFLEDLGRERQNSVWKYLTEVSGVPAERLTMPGPDVRARKEGPAVFIEFTSDIE